MTDSMSQRVEDTRWRPSGRQIAIAILVGLVALFGAVNFEKTSIDFLVDSVRIPLVFVIAACSLLGFLAGYLFARHLDKKD
ncbi:MAG: LapA family protein [Acidimicrobiia bacterium]